MMGPGYATLAWRNIWRNRRRTLITLFGMSFGVLLAVVFMGMGDSSYGAMIDHSARLGSGHVIVQHAGYQDAPNLKKSVGDVSKVIESAEATPNVERAVARISGAGLVATATSSQGTSFIAVDPAAEDEATMALVDSVAEGEMLSDAQGNGMLLGAGLAKALGVSLGKKVVFTATDRNGEIVSALARVKGIIVTGSPSLDRNLCVLPIDSARETLGYGPQDATQVAVFVADHRTSGEVAAALRPGLASDAVALTWAEASPELAGLIAIDRAGAIAFEIIVMLLLAASVFNTIFQSVMERTREFGIMAALGYSRGSLFAIVMWESLWVALTGLVVGALVTAWPYYYLATEGLNYAELAGEGQEFGGVAMDPILYVGIYAQSVAAIVIAVVLATLLAGLYPAWRAGRINPADVIRQQ